MSIAKRPDNLPGDFGFFYNTGPHCIIKIVVNIGNNIGYADNLPFKGVGFFILCFREYRAFPFGMLDDSVSDLICQIQSLPPLFEEINNSQTLDVMMKSPGVYFPQYLFTCMSEGSVAKIMAERNCFRQVVV